MTDLSSDLAFDLELEPQTDIDFSRCRQAIQDPGHGIDGPGCALIPDVRTWHCKVGVIKSIHHVEAKLKSHVFPQVEVLR